MQAPAIPHNSENDTAYKLSTKAVAKIPGLAGGRFLTMGFLKRLSRRAAVDLSPRQGETPKVRCYGKPALLRLRLDRRLEDGAGDEAGLVGNQGGRL